mmetsp:Transcript_35399/g.74725  ORF Transcript_35399/g.74725 Transcript_35399/m.74725 type:complete len:533 (+) Transcript_35399:86-1684(+)
MAKSKRGRTGATAGRTAQPSPKLLHQPSTDIALSQAAIDRHWDVLPPKAREFILGGKDVNGWLSVRGLSQFWSSPQNIEYTQGNLAGTICTASWYLALTYLKLGMFKEARALTINGSFIHQCYNSSIEYIKSFIRPGVMVCERNLPHFVRGIQATQSPQMMSSYIQSYLTPEYTHMMSSFANLSTQKHVMGYVGQISDDWNGTSPASRKSPSNSSGTQMKLILADDANEDERHCFDIDSTTTLKALFNDYAEKRGISLRSLRFSYAGKTLFLSSAGNRTPEQLGMLDQDMIMVHCTSKSQESNNGDNLNQKAPAAPKTKAKKRSNKKAKGKNKKAQQVKEPTKTVEEYKLEHSKKLTKLHEEADSQFRTIRQRLNNLVIERSQPKGKSKCSHTSKSKPALPSISKNPFKEGLGGKAGKSHFLVQIGEVQNLYKTTKASCASHYYTHKATPTLDLHGCTKEEALVKLDDSLKLWVDAAMQGSYPFVQPAVIVCGCGNQILSEVVESWIREKKNVANAPKLQSTRRQVYTSRAA